MSILDRITTSMSSDHKAATAKSWDMWSLKPAAIAIAVVLAIMAFWRIYQQVYGWYAGMDSTNPIFDQVWIGLMRWNLALISTGWAVTWAAIWLTRDRNLQDLKPREELRRYLIMVLFILVYAVAVWFGASFFAEQDASWHQVVVRDTSFTPSHIVLFYGAMPLYVLFGVGSFLYGMTRLPRFASQFSVPFILAVVGPFLILPNLGFNEWGHAFFLMEEVFSYPLHWGFVVMGWSVLALGGLLLQIVVHILDLMKQLAAEGTSAVIAAE